jgi:hypothetical protein
MMLIGHFSPREVDKMTMWECMALTTYHNYHNAKDEDVMLDDSEIADLEKDLEDWLKEP